MDASPTSWLEQMETPVKKECLQPQLAKSVAPLQIAAWRTITATYLMCTKEIFGTAEQMQKSIQVLFSPSEHSSRGSNRPNSCRNSSYESKYFQYSNYIISLNVLIVQSGGWTSANWPRGILLPNPPEWSFPPPSQHITSLHLTSLRHKIPASTQLSGP